MRSKILTTVSLASIVTIVSGASALADESSTPPPWNQADAIFGEEQMAKAREEVLAEGGGQTSFYISFNQLEVQSLDAEDVFVWNGQANWGGDVHKLWLKTEGHASLDGEGVEDAEVQVLYSRAISPFWNLQGGIRYDVEPDGLAHAVVAMNGLAPYWLEIDASAFLSETGDVTARFEAEYELLLTQRLILQPRVEANLSAQDIPDRSIGAGLVSVDAGLRLRYEIVREFAPYVGVEWQSSFRETRDAIEAGGGETEETVFLIGVRTWY